MVRKSDRNGGGRFVGWCEVASVVRLDRVGEQVLVAGMVEEGDKVVGPGGPVCGGICLSGPFDEDVHQDWVSAIPALIGCHGPILCAAARKPLQSQAPRLQDFLLILRENLLTKGTSLVTCLVSLLRAVTTMH